ncbi:SH3 domain-containing protein [Eubacteriales bacterium OttesenSCG-928-A19]|nr:SH3 domain-containing protein [Eubacteriales bacterium OttesenSCG-928-A19]
MKLSNAGQRATPLLLLLVLALLLPASAGAAWGATVAIGPAAVYATAHTGSPVVATLSAGSRVTVISYDANYAQISLGSESGYMITSYLTFDAPTPTIVPPQPMPTAPVIIMTATVVSGPLNVHSSATLRAPVIAELSTGSRVNVVSYNSSWTGILLSSGSVGYVVTSYLSIGGGVRPTAAPTATRHPVTQTANANATIQTANHGPLHLRSQPSKSASIIDSFANGSRIRVVSAEGGWYKVVVGTRNGYMDAGFVALDSGASLGGTSATTAPTNVLGGYDAVVANQDANQILHLRARPDTQSEILGNYHNGAYVEVIMMGEEWHHVRVDGKLGYMMAEFVDVTTPEATPNRVVNGGEETSVSLMKEPSATSLAITPIPSGSTVTVIIPDDTWSQVRYTVDGTMSVGYLENGYLALETPVFTELTVPGNG